MSEKIFLTYTNATKVPFMGTVMGHHIVVNYIDSNGKHHMLQGMPEHRFNHNFDKLIASSKSALTTVDANNGESSFGKLIADRERTDTDVSAGHPNTVVAEGDDLSSQWALMKDFADEVNSTGYEYRPLSQNSNSFAGGALQRAGLFGPGTKFPERFDSQLVFDPASGEIKSVYVPGFEKALANPINTETPMPFPLSLPSAPSAPRDEAFPPDQADSFGNRYGNWGSSPSGVPPLSSADLPESFRARFGNWGFAPVGASSSARSPLLRTPKASRSAAPDGASTPETPSRASSGGPSSSFDPQSTNDVYAARERAARLLAGVGRYVENSLVPSAREASPPETPYGDTTADADRVSPRPPIRRLVGVIDNPRASAFDNGATSVPFAFNGHPFADHRDVFDRLGSGISSEGGIVPQQFQDTAPSYSQMLLQYLDEGAAGPAQTSA